jgi:NADPH-dependent curcumin reductase CurA
VFYVCDKPKKGETVVVTGAAGAIGSVAAQLAKSTGARGESLKSAHVYVRMLALC